MKTFATLLALVCAVTCRAWVLSWTAPTNQPVLSYYAPGTNQAYKLYWASMAGTPSNSFTLLATFTNWTVTANADGSFSYSQTVLTNNPAPAFFLMTSSNIVGESVFSAMALTGPPAQPFFIESLTTK